LCVLLVFIFDGRTETEENLELGGILFIFLYTAATMILQSIDASVAHVLGLLKRIIFLFRGLLKVATTLHFFTSSLLYLNIRTVS
jgi:hypothetical protein